MSLFTAPRLSKRDRLLKAGICAIVALLLGAVLNGCGLFQQGLGDLNAALQGRSGTMSTYDEESQMVDQVKGTSFQFVRDTTFDTTNSEGSSNADSDVIQISLGSNVIHHVGSTLIFTQDGVTDISGSLPTTARFTNAKPGIPWLNQIREDHQNLWKGKAKTIMVRSQNGTPLAVFAGESVSIFAADIPKSTVLLIDQKYYVLIYRADYTIYDSALLGR